MRECVRMCVCVRVPVPVGVRVYARVCLCVCVNVPVRVCGGVRVLVRVYLEAGFDSARAITQKVAVKRTAPT